MALAPIGQSVVVVIGLDRLVKTRIHGIIRRRFEEEEPGWHISLNMKLRPNL